MQMSIRGLQLHWVGMRLPQYSSEAPKRKRKTTADSSCTTPPTRQGQRARRSECPSQREVLDADAILSQQVLQNVSIPQWLKRQMAEEIQHLF
jgi:hypothetical protein